MSPTFKPYCGISKVKSGYKITTRVRSEDKDDFDPHEEDFSNTLEEAVSKLNEYFQQYP